MKIFIFFQFLYGSFAANVTHCWKDGVDGYHGGISQARNGFECNEGTYCRNPGKYFRQGGGTRPKYFSPKIFRPTKFRRKHPKYGVYSKRRNIGSTIGVNTYNYKNGIKLGDMDL